MVATVTGSRKKRTTQSYLLVAEPSACKLSRVMTDAVHVEQPHVKISMDIKEQPSKIIVSYAFRD